MGEARGVNDHPYPNSNKPGGESNRWKGHEYSSHPNLNKSKTLNVNRMCTSKDSNISA